MTSAAVALAVVALLAGGCRRQPSAEEPVQKMAYRVKPAVVRVSAYAVADFRYSAAAVETAARELAALGLPSSLRNLPPGGGTTRAGAGGSGTGFIINADGFILTSGHVVAATLPLNRQELRGELLRNGAVAALIAHLPIDSLRNVYRQGLLDPLIDPLLGSSLGPVEIVDRVELSNGEAVPFELVSFSPPLSKKGSDLALLSVARRNLPVVRIAESESVRLQEPVWVIGYPSVASSSDELIGGWLSRESDLEATMNPGVITSIKRDMMQAPLFQTNAAIYRGNSGGPAVGRDGSVIGIATWGHANAEQIKFIVPVAVARAFVEEAKVAFNGESEFQALYDRALEEAWAGDWDDALDHLHRADALFPASPDLLRFMQEAEREIASRPLWRRNPAAAAVLLVVVGAVAALLTLRRRVPPPAPAGMISAPPPVERASPHGQAGEPRLTILNGEKAGQKLALGGSGIRIGREPAVCDIILDNPKVSRFHAEVVIADGRVLLIDQKSSNGTWVNDQRIERTFLNDGDIIYFGGRNAIAVAFHA